MKQTISTILFLSCLWSCDPCRDDDCPTTYPEISVDIRDSLNNSLLFKESSPFYHEKISAFAPLDGNIVPVRSNVAFGLLYLSFDEEISMVILAYEGNLSDTLEISYASRIVECCGEILEVQSISLNNKQICQNPCYDIWIEK